MLTHTFKTEVSRGPFFKKNNNNTKHLKFVQVMQIKGDLGNTSTSWTVGVALTHSHCSSHLAARLTQLIYHQSRSSGDTANNNSGSGAIHHSFYLAVMHFMILKNMPLSRAKGRPCAAHSRFKSFIAICTSGSTEQQ